MDVILSLQLLSKIHHEFGRPLYAAFIDLKSVFDSIDRSALWKALRGIGIPTLILNLMKDLYGSTHSKVRLSQNTSSAFQTRSGVRQGCVLVPALFCLAIHWILKDAFPYSGLS